MIFNELFMISNYYIHSYLELNKYIKKFIIDIIKFRFDYK